jgi:hypothetical protein
MYMPPYMSRPTSIPQLIDKNLWNGEMMFFPAEDGKRTLGRREISGLSGVSRRKYLGLFYNPLFSSTLTGGRKIFQVFKL